MLCVSRLSRRHYNQHNVISVHDVSTVRRQTRRRCDGLWKRNKNNKNYKNIIKFEKKKYTNNHKTSDGWKKNSKLSRGPFLMHGRNTRDVGRRTFSSAARRPEHLRGGRPTRKQHAAVNLDAAVRRNLRPDAAGRLSLSRRFIALGSQTTRRTSCFSTGETDGLARTANFAGQKRPTSYTHRRSLPAWCAPTYTRSRSVAQCFPTFFHEKKTTAANVRGVRVNVR